MYPFYALRPQDLPGDFDLGEYVLANREFFLHNFKKAALMASKTIPDEKVKYIAAPLVVDMNSYLLILYMASKAAKVEDGAKEHLESVVSNLSSLSDIIFENEVEDLDSPDIRRKLCQYSDNAMLSFNRLTDFYLQKRNTQKI
jgi:hypothetical protein